MRWKACIASFLAFGFLCGCSMNKVPEEEPKETVEELESIEEKEKQYLLKAYDDNLPSLKDVFAEDFLVGCAINTNRLIPGSDFYRTITKHYNTFVTENEMKPMYLNPSDGIFNFEAADEFVTFGEENEGILRGHTLIWHDQAPEWWFQGENNGRPIREELLARMENHITTVMQRYAGKIKIYDVVNECISDSKDDIRREDEKSYYASIIGDINRDGKDYDYIEKAFEYARAADPEAQLIINEYDLELGGQKLQTFYEMLKDMLQRGVPIDGAGIQCHIRMTDPELGEIQKTIELLASLKEYNPNFTVQITELDVSLFANGDQTKSVPWTKDLAQNNGEFWADLFDMFREEAKKGNLSLVTTWGVYDGASWLDFYPVFGRMNAPLLFDRGLKAKPAFWGVVDRNQLSKAVEEVSES